MTDGPQVEVEPIRRTVLVRTDPPGAFDLFTEGIGTWWPVEEYSRAVSEFEADGVRVTRLEFQARMGGSILEHMSDGRVLPWAVVVVWDPPRRVVTAWRPHSLPEPATELDVRFAPNADGSTIVEVEHRGWERLSEKFREELYGIYARGWITTLERFTAAADGGPALN